MTGILSDDSIRFVKMCKALGNPIRFKIVKELGSIPTRRAVYRARDLCDLAALPGVISYNPETCVLTFRRQLGFLTIYPEQVMITQVKDDEQGLELLSELK
jgi:hypothetical protein